MCFDPAKESKHIVGRARAFGENFVTLGVEFDCKLLMSAAVEGLVKECRWKLHRLLRTQQFYNSQQLIQLYKAQILSYVEYRTAAIYHACSSSLDALDAVQDTMLMAAAVSKLDALLHFNLAPLRWRRDIAMLGLIHRSVLGVGPPHFRKFFMRSNISANAGRHRWQLKELEADSTVAFACVGLLACIVHY